MKVVCVSFRPFMCFAAPLKEEAAAAAATATAAAAAAAPVLYSLLLQVFW